MLPVSTTERSAAFSLLEVVIAVALFAGTITVVIALFGPLNHSISDVSANGRAARLTDAIDVELLRIRDSQVAPVGGTKLDAMVASLLPKDKSVLQLVASSDGSHLVRVADAGNDPLSGVPPGVLLRDQYYLIEIHRQPDKDPTGQPNPLAYTVGASAFLALTATVKWPYQVANGPGATDAKAADLTQAKVLIFNFALPP